MGRDLRATAALFATALVIAVGAFAQDAAKPSLEAQRITDATTVFSSVMSAEDKTIPRAILEKAHGIVVFPYAPAQPSLRGQGPNTRRLAAQQGIRARGILSVRTESGAWSTPAFVSLAGGNRRVGDVVVVAVTRRGLERLLSGEQLVLASEYGVAAGSLGASHAQMDVPAGTEILTFSRSRVHSPDAPLDESMIQHDLDANKQFYGKPLTGSQATAQTAASEPVAAWRAALEKHTK